MSFILDALRKSEIERQRQNGPSIAEFAAARIDNRPPWALIAVGVLLALNAGVILWFLLRDTTQATEPAAAASAAIAKIAKPPVAPPPAPLPAREAAPPVMAAVPPPAESMSETLPPEPEATMAPAAPDPTLVPAPPVSRPGVTYDNTAPTADALTTQAAEGLPELSMDLHIFSADPSKRAIFVNGRRYTEGATLAEGPRVEEITREGAVLNYRGRRFLLPRL